MDRAGFAENLAALDLGALNAAEQGADVVAGLGVVEDLAEHLDAGDDGLLLLVGKTDDLDLVASLQLAALDTAGGDGAAAGDGEDVLNRHQERQVGLALRSRDILVDSVHELEDAGILGSGRVGAGALEGLQRGTLDDGDVVAGEVVAGEQLTDFHLDELEQLGIVDLVDLVHIDDDIGNADLTGEQDVLTGLGHRAVGGGDDEDRAVHLRGAGDHVLDVVGMSRAVDMRVVALVGLVLNVRGVDGDAALPLFRGLIDHVIRFELGLALHRENLGDRRGQRGLAVVNVSDRTNVDMGLVSFKMCLCHRKFPPL